MLRFDRESFKSGVMLVKEPDPAHPGEFLKYMLRPQQKGMILHSWMRAISLLTIQVALPSLPKG